MAAASDQPPLTVRTRWRAGTVTIEFSGDLDLCTKPVLAQLLGDVLAQQPERLVLELARVTFLDCAAAEVLAAASRRLPRTGPAVIRRMSRPAGRLLWLTGLIRHFEVDDSFPGTGRLPDERRPGEPGPCPLARHSPSPARGPLGPARVIRANPGNRPGL